MDKILVNIDFKFETDSLLQKAVHLARQHSASIELFCCCYNRSIKHGYLFDKLEEQKAEHAYVRQMESKLEALSVELQSEGLEVGYDACWDRHASEGVIRKVLRYEPDLLMHSVQPHNRVGHYLFAPVDWQIARKCPIPVLFSKPRIWKDLTRLVACIDPLHQGDEEGKLDRSILKQAKNFSPDGFSELHILHCYNTLPHEAIFDEQFVTDYDALQVKVEKQHFMQCHALLEEFNVNIDSDLVDIIKGETELTIKHYADHKNIDVIVMGAVARSVFDRLLVGSTMEYVVDHVDCDVLIVKTSDFKCPVKE